MEDLKKLIPLIKDIPFFKDRNLNGAMLLDIVSIMEYKSVQQENYVFEYGDLGDNFYLLLNGSVEVQIPDIQKRFEFE
jgi:hypothetical protein